MRSRLLAHAIDDPGRRQFLWRSASAALGVAALPWLQGLGANDAGGAPFVLPRATRVINLFMAGGMCHFDSFDPKPRLAQESGASPAIPTSADGMRFGTYLPLLAQQGHELTVIRSVSTTQGAHEQGQYYLRTGYVARGTIRHPSLGSWADRLRGRRNPSLPGAVVIGGGSDHPGGGFLPSAHAPLALGAADDGLPHSSPHHAIDEDRQERRMRLLAELERVQEKRFHHRGHVAYRSLYHEALALMNSRDLKAFDIESEDEALLAEYGETRFGLGCALARRLVEHDVRFVEVTMGGWDSHVDHALRMEERLPQFDLAASTLIRDLRRRGLLDSTIVMITTEFGRTPDLNTNDGRDHHPKVFSCALAGGPFRGGLVYGASDERGEAVADKRVLVPDLHASVGHALGLPVDHVVMSDTGRPFTVGDKGRVIGEWFA